MIIVDSIRNWFAANPDKKMFLWYALAFAAAVQLVAYLALPELTAHYKIGFDGQKQRCLPWMIYITKIGDKSHLVRGEIVQFRAAGIGFGLDGKNFIKFIAGVPGDTLTVKDRSAYVNGEYWGGLWLLRALNKSATAYDRVIVVPPGYYLAMSVGMASYDGRYWGLIRDDQIIGRSAPII